MVKDRRWDPGSNLERRSYTRAGCRCRRRRSGPHFPGSPGGHGGLGNPPPDAPPASDLIPLPNRNDQIDWEFWGSWEFWVGWADWVGWEVKECFQQRLQG